MGWTDPPPEPRSRRTFSEAPRPIGLRDSDVGERTVVFNALLGGLPGAILGTALGFFLWKSGGSPWMMPLCAVVTAVLVAGLALWVTRAAGRAGGALHAPSSGSTPRRREYSQAESLVARGLYPEAITAFELAVAEDPRDPTPYLRVARIYRDHLERFEDAARWFRRGLREAELSAGIALLARKELVELFTHRLRDPRRALPDLARMAEELEGSPEGEWAAAELADIKARMRQE